MSDTNDLLAIADQLANLREKFRQDSNEMYLVIEDQSHFSAIVTETRAILFDALGPANHFSLGIASAIAVGSGGGVFGGPSYECVSNVESLIRASIRQVERKAKTPAQSILRTSIGSPYVSLDRISELRSLPKKQWDFAKLIQLCNELNEVAASGKANYATAMLVRAIVDHVPPLFDKSSFGQVADNYSGTASFKGSMQHLNRSLRHIADGILHEQIRRQESLPSPQQVDFKQDLDRLLGEIVRTSKPVTDS